MVPSIPSGNPPAGEGNTINRLPRPLGRVSEDPNVIRFPAYALRNQISALVVDNHKCCRIVQTGIIQYYGIHTMAVETGQDAIDMVAAGLFFDLIVIDSRLPILSGVDTIMHMRAMGVWSKIIGMTGSSRERERQLLLEAGADEVVEKPLVPERLVPILMELDGCIYDDHDEDEDEDQEE